MKKRKRDKKIVSGMKRMLIWGLATAIAVQSCAVVYADEGIGESDVALLTDEITDGSFEEDGGENNPEVSIDEDSSADIEVSEDGEDDREIGIAEEEQADESGVDLFSDGRAAQMLADDTDTSANTKLKREEGKVTIVGNEQYSYTRLYDANDYIRWAVGQYPASGSTMTMNVNDQRVAIWQFDLVRNDKKDYTDKDITWYNATSNTSYVKKPITWTSSDPSIVEINTGNSYPYSSVKLKALKESSEPVTITAEWEDTRYSTGTITNSFQVIVKPARKVVDVDEPFELKGSVSSPYEVTNGTDSDFWTSDSLSEVERIKVEGDGAETLRARYRVWSESGEILHKYAIDFEGMIDQEAGSKSNYFRNYSNTETLSQPVRLPSDGIYLKNVSYSGHLRYNNETGNLIITQPSSKSNSNLVQFYIISNGVKDNDSTITWTSSNEDVVKINRANHYSYGTSELHLYSGTSGYSEITGTCGDYSIKFKVFVKGFYINDETVDLSLDEEDHAKSKQISYTMIDGSGDEGIASSAEGITWTIDKPTVASVDSDGNVTAKSAGEAIVTATCASPSTTDTVRIVVRGSGSLAFDASEYNIKKNGNAMIQATAVSNGTTIDDPEITWATEDANIATVDAGQITGISEGTTTVSASWTADNGKTYTQSAAVNVVYDGLYLSDAQNEITMPQGSTQEIVWQIQDMGEYYRGSTGEGYQTCKDVTWKSADEDIARVDAVGVITAGELPEGETTASTTVTVSYKGTEVKTISVHVMDNQAIAAGTTAEVAGTKGETKTDKDGMDKSNTWKAGSYADGHGSLNGAFNSNAKYLEIAADADEAVSVTGKSPSAGYVYLSHKYYIPLTTGQLCGVWEGIAVKVTGAAGLYLNKSSVSMKMGESDTATIQGTYITERGEEWEHWADEKHPDFSTIHMIDGDTSVVTAEPDPKNGSVLNLTAVAPGKTTITVQFDTSTLTADCDVIVTSDARLVLEPSELTVKKGDTATITAKAWDGSDYVENPEITWKSYDESIATVVDGVVTGVDRGNAVIGAVWKDVTSNEVQVKVLPSRNITVSTEWKDSDDQDGIRPLSASIQLTANGELYGYPIELNADNGWTYEWKLLDAEDAKGNNIVYRVTAENPEGYTAKIAGSADDGFIVTYTHETAKKEIEAKVIWNDADNQDKIRPADVLVQLYADGSSCGDKAVIEADKAWSRKWSDLPKYKAGKEIVYTIAVNVVSGYTASITGNATAGFTIEYTHSIQKNQSNQNVQNERKFTLKLSRRTYIYNGKTAKPKVTVYRGKTKISSKYYSVTYKNNKRAGYATVTVKGKGKYAGYSGKTTFTIKPKTMSRPSVKRNGRKTLKVSWKRDSQVTRYIVQYSRNKKFKGKTTRSVVISGNKRKTTTLKKLTGGKYYYVRIRGCKVVNGKNIYAPSWSKVVKIKVK